jgi:deoxyinosine 3'endonuclease (endonuclease V)
MRGLGYERYGAQGGDFGAGIATFMALKNPEPMIGVHLSNLETAPYTGSEARPLSAAERTLSRAQRGILARGVWLQGNPVHEAPDAGIRAERLARWARRLDSGKVALLGRFRR